jgi:hypothetical protein
MKKIFRMALVCALAGATLLYTGCTKDYSDDINGLKKSVSDLETELSTLQAKINAGYVITNVQRNSADDGWVFTLAGSGDTTKTYEVKDGKKGNDGVDGDNGKNGSVVTIGTDGYWYIDNVKQDVKAVAQNGDKGADGLTPYIKDGYWWIGDKNTGVKAEGVNGTNGTNGTNGLTPRIGEDGNWWIGDENTGVKAQATAVSINEDGYICLDGVATNVKAGSIAVWDQTAGTVKVLGADGEVDFEIGVCELESIVFVPQLYFEGIEAARYNYFYGKYNKANTKAPEAVNDDENKDGNVKAIPVEGFTHSFAVDAKVYSIGEIATAEYHVNPNSFDLAKADFELQGVTKQTMTRATITTETWKPVLKSIARPEAGKNAVVTYQIENAHLATGVGEEGTTTGDVAVMRLRGTVQAGKKAVDSDYEAIVPFREEFHHLAFTNASGYATAFSAESGSYPCKKCNIPEPNDKRELYVASTQAMQQVPSVKLNYLDTLDILNIIDVHYHPASANEIHSADYEAVEKTITLKELLAEYPGLSAEYQLIGYKIGDNGTREDMYGKIEGSKFFPCWVDEDGETQYKNADKVGGYDGQSSVGRKPIVLVTLKDAKGVLLYGYFKIQITKEATPLHKDFIIKEFPAFPYVCKGSVKTTWAECSSIVLEKNLGMTYMEFKDRYVSVTSPDGKTYVKTAEGFKEESKYGKFVFSEDKKTSAGTNDVFGIEVSTLAQVDSIAKNGPVTLYTKFGTDYDYVFIGLTVDAAKPAQATFIKHNPTYWYKPSDCEKADLIIVNPRVATHSAEENSWTYNAPQAIDKPAFKVGAAGSSVTGYGLNLEKAWEYNRVQVQFDAETMKAYKNAFGTAELPIKYHFEFSDDQPVIAGEKLYVDHKNQRIYWKEENPDYILGFMSKDIVRTYDDPDNEEGTRATYQEGFSNVDLICYKHDGTKKDTKAKEILNTYVHPATSVGTNLDEKLSDFLYFNVELQATYGDCDIPCGTEEFHVAFFRPVDINSNDTEGVKDGLKGGDYINLGDMFTATDWQGDPIYEWNAEKEKYVPYTTEVEGKSFNWYTFYGFETIDIYTDEIETNQTGEVKYLKTHGEGANKVEGVNNSVVAHIANASEPSVAAGAGIKKMTDANGYTYYECSIKSTDNLDDYVFFYANHSGVAQNFELYVPVAVKYWWGTIKTKLTIPVIATIAE